jgi:hypothetical protein
LIVLKLAGRDRRATGSTRSEHPSRESSVGVGRAPTRPQSRQPPPPPPLAQWQTSWDYLQNSYQNPVMAGEMSDEDYARQLQEQEFRQAGIEYTAIAPAGSGPGAGAGGAGGAGGAYMHNMPRLSATAAGARMRSSSMDDGSGGGGAGFGRLSMGSGVARGDGRIVQRNAMENVEEARDLSPKLLLIAIIFGLGELIASIVVLSQSWDAACDKPLQYWLLAFSARHIILVPIFIRRYVLQRRGDVETRVKRWVDLLVFVTFIFGQIFVYNSSSCSSTAPLLYRYCLALLIIQYVKLALPIILIFMLCLCLPVVLLLMRVFAPSAGAPADVIRALPTRTITAEELQARRANAAPAAATPSSDGNDATERQALRQGDDEEPSCAVSLCCAAAAAPPRLSSYSRLRCCVPQCARFAWRI